MAMSKEEWNPSIPNNCVYFELESVDEEQTVAYLNEHTYSYQWILRQESYPSKPGGKIKLCVWWRKEHHKLFCTTPLRSFLKRLKNKAGYEKIEISKPLTTNVAVHMICKGGTTISKYYLEGPLETYLRGILDLPKPKIVKQKCNQPTQNLSTLDVLSKLHDLQKLVSQIVPEVSQRLRVNQWVSEVNAPPSSPLLTHAGDLQDNDWLEMTDVMDQARQIDRAQHIEAQHYV